jgi:hypothetical protein
MQEKAGLTTAGTYSGVGERIAYGIGIAGAMKLVAWGWITADDAAWLAGGFVGLVGGAWAWWINRPKAIIQSAASTGATVITNAEIAATTPETNIVSADAVRVTPK